MYEHMFGCWGWQIALALRFLHSRTPPVVHRDLKPANVMLVEGGKGLRIKLSDFGLASAKLNSMRTLAGTVGYAAPEIFQQVRLSQHGRLRKLTGQLPDCCAA